MPHTITKYHSILKSFYSDPSKLGGKLPFSEEKEGKVEEESTSLVNYFDFTDPVASTEVKKPTPAPNAYNYHMQCLANNYSQCHWHNTTSEGLEDGGWSALYMKCKLYELPEVQPLSGIDAITQWCDSKKS